MPPRKLRVPDAPEQQPQDDTEAELLALAEACLAGAEKRGASAAELSLSRGQGLTVTARGEDIETLEYHQDQSFSISLYYGEHTGSASSTDLGEPAIERALDAAQQIARHTEPDPCSGLADAKNLADAFPPLDLHHPWSGDTDAAIGQALTCEQAARAFDKRITNSEGSSFTHQAGSSVYANSLGFVGLSRGTRYTLSSALVAGEGESMQRDYDYRSCRKFEDLPPAAELGERAAARALKRLGARKIDTGSYPVVFEQAVSGGLLGSLVSAISGGSLYRQASFLLDHKGKRLFPEFIHIHECPLEPGAAVSSAFDGDGVATRSRDLVKDGILTDYVLDTYAGRKLDLPSTGNAGGVRNLTLDPTLKGGLPALLKEIGRGVLVTELIGSGTNIVTGDYSRGAFGYWFENGEIQYPVQEFTIAGNLRDMFAGVQAAADDIDWHRSTRAGSIALEPMTIAGQS